MVDSGLRRDSGCLEYFVDEFSGLILKILCFYL
jgi:hypothetical protein